MGNDIASITLTRNTWSAIFVAQLGYLFSILRDREGETPGSEEWLRLDSVLKDPLRSFMPALEAAAQESHEIGNLYFELRRMAGCFQNEGREDIIKEVVEFHDPSPGDLNNDD